MIIFICCKNKKSLKYIHEEVQKYCGQLNSNFVVFNLTSNYVVFATDNLCIHLFLEQEQEIRGYRADLIYAEQTVNKQYIHCILSLALRPPIIGYNKNIKFSRIPIQTFEIRR